MSYKYLYGFTNERSYDFSKVIYFGKQDRAATGLSRITEHWQESDINHKELAVAKYVIFAMVETGVDLLDLEAYFIQTYCPKLNTINNPHYARTLKLSKDEIKTIKPVADSLTWYCIRNTQEDADCICRLLETINESNKAISNASHIFKSKDELLNTSFKDIQSMLSNGYGIIKPLMSNSMIDPLLQVKAYTDSIIIKDYFETPYKCRIESESINYKISLRPFLVPELGISFHSPIIIKSREYANEEMTPTAEYIDLTRLLFNCWRVALNIYCEKLYEVEPNYCNEIRFSGFFEGDDYCYVGPGYNSKNHYLIKRIQNTFKADEKYARNHTVIELLPFLSDEYDVSKISNMRISEYLSYFKGLPKEEATAIENTMIENEIESWMQGIKRMATDPRLEFSIKS